VTVIRKTTCTRLCIHGYLNCSDETRVVWSGISAFQVLQRNILLFVYAVGALGLKAACIQTKMGIKPNCSLIREDGMRADVQKLKKRPFFQGEVNSLHNLDTVLQMPASENS
jgi:hypothetical protein